ncbi:MULTISPECIES: hypothetical protein [Alphaproteobacteria]|uniref:Uncharacterized protein n=2 Tax=Alphaproteobacteria TaxID=28211 RepID=A0A512HLZ4_9HYPH|nr:MULTISPECIES: hypothetical protein [Alphaproteobacteria]GEO86449.1 hypothetical protein RNA01_33810 [Ciceribacter naphthalenivorans]GLR22327.1 hypothetical protein GCM10007920_21140 [Ciceribacter naphthalenivorans]GLT05183.1 hypothetical protein GCM10007926_21140 [Sphingomonas psychrolutea]
MGTALLIRASLLGLLLAGSPAFADDIDQLPVTATFVVSGGYWEGDAGDETTATPVAHEDDAQEPAPRRGYYKLISIRQPDRTAKVYLQRILSTETGPAVQESIELEEFTGIHPYVTDIRPEDSTGVSRQPGFFATVYLKTDPAQVEPEGWTVLIDEFGEIRVERETN